MYLLTLSSMMTAYDLPMIIGFDVDGISQALPGRVDSHSWILTSC